MFNGKELDRETGLYYYGGRYYSVRDNIMYGVDKMAEKYPSFGGYVYSFNNPINFIDPDGNDPVPSVMVLMGKINKIAYNNAIALVGAGDAVGDAATLGIGSAFGAYDHSGDYSGSQLKSYYIGKILGDISMIAIGGETFSAGAGTAAAGLATGPGAVVISTGGAVTAGYGAGMGTTAAINLVKNLAALKKLGVDLMQTENTSGGGRGSNNRTADDEAVGDHTVINSNGSTTYKVEPKNPKKNSKGVGFKTEKRVDYRGAAHVNKKTGERVETPHVQENGGVRPAVQGEDMPAN